MAGAPWGGYSNIVSGSMSLDMASIFAKGEGGTVSTASSVGTVFHVDLCKSNYNPLETIGYDKYKDGAAVIYADMRWISKFRDEHEWLMVPCSTWSGIRLGKSRSEPLASGGELLHQECWWGI